MHFEKTLTPGRAFRLYEQGLAFNSGMNLDSEVETNENFFIGRQWEGVQANGLPTPVFNFLKRVTLFTVASVTTDNLKLRAEWFGRGEDPLIRAVNTQFEALFEHNRVGNLIREMMRNAAVDGDGCTYTYWDENAVGTGGVRGAIVTELVENTRVFFGNPNERRVQKQPWVLIEKRECTGQLRDRALELGVPGAEDIPPDSSGRTETKTELLGGEKTTVLMLFYRGSSGTVRCYECTRELVLSHRDTGLHRYPVTWLNWDYRRNNYHGQALISGLIPNQIFVNKLFAMSMISLMTTAYPKVIYDETRVSSWDNRVGAAIGIKGGDVNGVAKLMDPAQVSPQIAQFIQLAVEYTQDFLGATPSALGDVEPENSSAIIALQRASSAPHELVRQNLYETIEELGRIYLEYMAEYYGVRTVYTADGGNTGTGSAPEGRAAGNPENRPVVIDFRRLSHDPLRIRLDVGASAYWSEAASLQTLDNLMAKGKITVEDYLERLPEGYINGREALLEKIRARNAESGTESYMKGESTTE